MDLYLKYTIFLTAFVIEMLISCMHQGPHGSAVVPGDKLLQAEQHTRGAKSGDYDSSRSFLLKYLWRNMSVCFCFSFYIELRQFSAKLLVKKLIF